MLKVSTINAERLKLRLTSLTIGMIVASLMNPARLSAQDCNNNGIDDPCEVDCGTLAGPCDIPGCGTSQDCNGNGVPDECDLAGSLLNQVTPEQTPFFDEFGSSVDVEGSTAVVGAHDTGSGRAYVYHNNNGTWEFASELIREDASFGHDFGISVAISGDTIVVGCQKDNDNGTDSGSAYVFREVNGQWSQTAKLLATDGQSGDLFGFSVAIDGATVVVGAYKDNVQTLDRGSAYVFRQVLGSWQQVTRLSSGTQAFGGYQFGYDVSISGSTVAVGSPVTSYNRPGWVFIYCEIDGLWRQVAQLVGHGNIDRHRFGSSIVIQDNTVVIGSPEEGLGGASYVFGGIDSAWRLTQRLEATDADHNDDFGCSVAFDGTTILIGDCADDNSGTLESGSAYVFRDVAGRWREVKKLSVPDAESYDYLGSAVAVDGGSAVLGIPGDNYGNSSGAILFVRLPEALDCNSNGVPDMCDLAGGMSADCNANGTPDECEADCNGNSLPDMCDISGGTSNDCNGNDVPDECDIQANLGSDCNGNGIPDGCELDVGSSTDCNGNEILDECEITSGAELDCNANAVPDSCDLHLNLTATLYGSESHPNDYFCSDLALSGDTVVVGAQFENGNGIERGAAYVFRRIGGDWQQVARLEAEDGVSFDHFGNAVAFDGTTVAVGAIGDEADRGAVYLFREINGEWPQTAKLIPADGMPGDDFGTDVAIHGDTVIVGAVNGAGGDTYYGTAYVFREQNGEWQQVAELARVGNPQLSISDTYGGTVALHGDLVVIGNPDDTEIQNSISVKGGAIYVFREVEGNWIFEAKLRAPSRHYDAEFGTSIATDGNRILVGAPGDRNPLNHAETGVVHEYRRINNNWRHMAMLHSPALAMDYEFGTCLSLHEDILAVGAVRFDPTEIARFSTTFLYREVDGQWRSSMQLLPGRLSALGHDYQVALGQDNVFTGPHFNERLADESGILFRFGLTQSLPELDCDENGIPDSCDLGTGRSQDCNGNGVPDVCDISDNSSIDCDGNGVPDSCDLQSGVAVDCNNNGVPDECDINAINLLRIKANDAAASDYFGRAVAIDGNTAVIGAPNDDDGGSNSGAAYRFRRIDSDWLQTEKLVPDDTAPGDFFGSSVAVCGGRTFVGSSGAVYVFEENGGISQQVVKLTADDLDPNDFFDAFGSLVLCDTDTLVVAADRADVNAVNSGAVYVFEEIGGVWSQTAKLSASDGAAQDRFGNSIALDGDTIVVGAYSNDDGANGSGAAYVFRNANGQWQQVAKLLDDDPENSDYFGRSVAISDSLIAVGVPGEDDGLQEGGFTAIFEETGGVWQLSSKITGPDTVAGDGFGARACLNDTTLVVSASRNNGAGMKQVILYTFEKVGGLWIPSGRLEVGPPIDLFIVPAVGELAFESRSVIAGFPYADPVLSDQGAAYLFDVPTATDCDANARPDQCDRVEPNFLDCDGNGVADQCEIDIGAALDCNNNGVPDGCDLTSGPSVDCNLNGIPDECETDCNANSVPDDCDIETGVSLDCNANAIPDGCEIADGSALDCNANALLDQCDIATNISRDCNTNDVPDECELADGMSTDCNLNGILDECDLRSRFKTKVKRTLEDVNDQFGSTVAIDGDRAIVGMDRISDPLGGTVAVYQNYLGYWLLVDTLVADDAAQGSNFGYTVAIEGAIAVVAAPSEDSVIPGSGAIYVFEEIGGSWIQSAKLKASDPDGAAGFGNSVAVVEDTIVVGSPRDDDEGAGVSAGSVYVFQLMNNDWQEVTKLTASDGAEYDYFGTSLALNDDTLVVGTRLDDDPNAGNNAGSAYIFHKSGSNWQEVQKLTASDGSENDNFGSAVAIHGTTIAVAARNHISIPSGRIGAVYLFQATNGIWTEIDKLTSIGTSLGDGFSSAVAMKNNTVLVGAQFRYSEFSQAGAVDVFSRSNGTWQLIDTITASDGMYRDYLGASIAVSGEVALIGAPHNDEVPTSGSAYFFNLPVSTDCNLNTIVDECEFDFDGDGIINPCDQCPGFDDNIDENGNGIPDSCDPPCGTIEKGDVDGSGAVDLGDVGTFAAIVLDSASTTSDMLCAADINEDASVNGDDIQGFIDLLLIP